MLIDYIFRLPPNDRRHLVLHADNCVGQNKNNTMLKVFMWLCLMEYCETIEFKFMIKGHTKFAPDGNFGHIKRAYAVTSSSTLEQVKSCIQDASVANTCKIFPSSRFKDYRSSLDHFFKNIRGIANYQQFKISNASKGKVTMCVGASSPETVTLDLVKDHDLVDLEYEFIPDTLPCPELTERKRTDIRRVMRYVPEDFHGFYN
eukprot:NODE_248_length_12985_cov_0.286357.p6 type:complete len:203 gc:universal NODE_248_length_12985_cov_0.286357:11564-10956(-)